MTLEFNSPDDEIRYDLIDYDDIECEHCGHYGVIPEMDLKSHKYTCTGCGQIGEFTAEDLGLF